MEQEGVAEQGEAAQVQAQPHDAKKCDYHSGSSIQMETHHNYELWSTIYLPVTEITHILGTIHLIGWLREVVRWI